MPVNLRAPVTLLDVAQRAGVSVATASRVLNGGDRVPRPELQERVREAAAALGYTPNAQAQALAKSSTNVVGILVHDIEDPYFAAIANGVMRAADERGLLVMMASTFRDADREIAYLSSLRAQRARAAVMIGSRRTDAEGLARTATRDRDVPRTPARVSRWSVSRACRRTRSSRTTVRARPSWPVRWWDSACGSSAYWLGRTGWRPRGTGATDSSRGWPSPGWSRWPCRAASSPATAGTRRPLELLDRKLDLDCLFAVNDVMAVGAMSALRGRGIDVPGELGVAGFDDIATLRDVWPGLTTVRLPLEQMGRRALELAVEGGEPQTETFTAEVVLRESTARR